MPLDRCDLHLHSIYSDGLASPMDLCSRAVRERLWALSLTDHDTVAGCEETARIAEQKGLTFVPGCELSSGGGGNTHILCYGPGVYSPAVGDWLKQVAQNRPNRAAAILDKLQQLGISLSAAARQQLLSLPNVGRMHIARAMVAEGFAASTAECFGKYLHNAGPAYVERKLPAAMDTVAALSGHCRTVLAHPMRIGLRMNEIYSFVLALKGVGLWGVECYHPSMAHAQSRLLAAFVQREGLYVTGGSDDHSGGRRGAMGVFYRHGENMRQTVALMLQKP